MPIFKTVESGEEKRQTSDRKKERQQGAQTNKQIKLRYTVLATETGGRVRDTIRYDTIWES
jgi:hypothetical protein